MKKCFIFLIGIIFIVSNSYAQELVNVLPIPKKMLEKKTTSPTLEKLFVGKKTAVASKLDKEKSPIFYQKNNIIVSRKQLPQTSSSLLLDVEIRDGASLYIQNGWFNLSSYVDKSGILMAFAKPDKHPITSSSQYAPVDILFIDKQGKIVQIAPNIALSELEQEIYPESPILAFLFLKGGSCVELSINVGDEIQYNLFKKPPLILNSSSAIPQPVAQPVVVPTPIVTQTQKPIETAPEVSSDKLNQFSR